VPVTASHEGRNWRHKWGAQEAAATSTAQAGCRR